MDSKKRFSNRVENYVKYRPGYPQEAIEFIFERAKLNDKSVIADIGSGTGILTKYFNDRVSKIFAVEPNDEMRTAAETLLKSQKNFVSVNGSAERTTLDDNSLDGIIVAQAFHWFDRNKVKQEFKRILKKNGLVILLWNSRLTNTPFLTEYELILKKYANDYSEINHQNLSKADLDNFYSEYKKRAFANRQFFDFEGLIGRVQSSSYCPLPGEVKYAVLFENLERAFNAYSRKSMVEFIYETVVYIGKI
jgi:ubiquinone/menaquinone biosynthesis C-methylase UbiE